VLWTGNQIIVGLKKRTFFFYPDLLPDLLLLFYIIIIIVFTIKIDRRERRKKEKGPEGPEVRLVFELVIQIFFSKCCCATKKIATCKYKKRNIVESSKPNRSFGPSGPFLID
jgi:hypothetical protein